MMKNTHFKQSGAWLKEQFFSAKHQNWKHLFTYLTSDKMILTHFFLFFLPLEKMCLHRAVSSWAWFCFPRCVASRLNRSRSLILSQRGRPGGLLYPSTPSAESHPGSSSLISCWVPSFQDLIFLKVSVFLTNSRLANLLPLSISPTSLSPSLSLSHTHTHAHTPSSFLATSYCLGEECSEAENKCRKWQTTQAFVQLAIRKSQAPVVTIHVEQPTQQRAPLHVFLI